MFGWLTMNDAESKATGANELRAMLPVLPEKLRPPDPESPRGRILSSALALFALQGFDGTSTRSVAEAAGVNLAMIHYYYGSKEQLYERVLASEIIGMVHGAIGSLPDDAEPEDALLSLPIRLMTLLRATPHRSALFRREIAAGAEHFKAAIRELGEFGPFRLREVFQRAYEAAVKRGRLRDLSPDAVRECLFTIGFGSLFVLPLLSVFEGRDFKEEAIWDEWTRTLNTLLRQGLLVESK
jgi:AcrR family transcriptional regulator